MTERKAVDIADSLRAAGDALRDDMIFLDAVAATGGEESRQVTAAIDAIDATLAAYTAI